MKKTFNEAAANLREYYVQYQNSMNYIEDCLTVADQAQTIEIELAVERTFPFKSM